jgi:prolyl-tRNA synthetase
MASVETPGQHTIEEVSAFVGVAPSRCLKTLLVDGADGGLVALVLRGDHVLNEVKAGKLPELAQPLTFAAPARVREVVGCDPGSLGPVGIPVPVIADHAAAHVADFVCGANVDGRHLTGVSWGRDLPEPRTLDLRNVVDGDPSPDGAGVLTIARGIEVGHIFQLGKKYSEAMSAVCLDEEGRPVTLIMGCYGIGVSRVVAAAIEQSHDERGIIWPTPIAPFQVALLPMNMHKSARLQEGAEALYAELEAEGVEVLFDDRPARPGVMFADMELIGIPHRLVLGDKGIDAGTVEHRGRRDAESQQVPRGAVVDFLRERLQGGN